MINISYHVEYDRVSKQRKVSSKYTFVDNTYRWVCDFVLSTLILLMDDHSGPYTIWVFGKFLFESLFLQYWYFRSIGLQVLKSNQLGISFWPKSFSERKVLDFIIQDIQKFK